MRRFLVLIESLCRTTFCCNSTVVPASKKKQKNKRTPGASSSLRLKEGNRCGRTDQKQNAILLISVQKKKKNDRVSESTATFWGQRPLRNPSTGYFGTRNRRLSGRFFRRFSFFFLVVVVFFFVSEGEAGGASSADRKYPNKPTFFLLDVAPLPPPFEGERIFLRLRRVLPDYYCIESRVVPIGKDSHCD